MKRIILALAGYAFYRWWNERQARDTPAQRASHDRSDDKRHNL